MQAVWKDEIPLQFVLKLCLPQKAKFLSFQMQSDKMMLWSQVDPENPIGDYKFHLVGAGQERIEESWLYVGTCLNGAYVWHLYLEATTDGSNN